MNKMPMLEKEFNEIPQKPKLPADFGFIAVNIRKNAEEEQDNNKCDFITNFKIFNSYQTSQNSKHQVRLKHHFTKYMPSKISISIIKV